MVGFLIGHRPNGLQRPVSENGDISGCAADVFSETLLQPPRECKHFTCDCFIDIIIMFYILLYNCCEPVCFFFFFQLLYIDDKPFGSIYPKKKKLPTPCTSYQRPRSTIVHLLPRMLRITISFCKCSKLLFGISRTIKSQRIIGAIYFSV